MKDNGNFAIAIANETQMRLIDSFEMIRGIGLDKIKNSVGYETAELKGLIEFYETREKRINELLDKNSDYSIKLLLATTFRIYHLFTVLATQETQPDLKTNCIPEVHPDLHPIDNLFSYEDKTGSLIELPESTHIQEVKKITGLMNALTQTIDKHRNKKSETNEKQ